MEWIDQVECDENVKFICVECGAEDYLRMNIVMQLDAMDARNTNIPPHLTCKGCGRFMIPEKYTGISGKRYTFEEYKDLI